MTLERFAALERLASAVSAWKQIAKESRALSSDFKLQLAEMDARREMFVALADVERTGEAQPAATVTSTRAPEPRAVYREQVALLRESMQAASKPPETVTASAT